jgi:Reverse transcriptase (RNA-dependent DNA polymerase).
VERQAKRGCPQGSVLRSKFWILITDGLLRQLEELPNTQPIVYSDNLVILIPRNSRRTLEERGAVAMAILESWTSSNKLSVSERKIPGSKLHRPVQGALPEHLYICSAWLGKKTQATSPETAASST